MRRAQRERSFLATGKVIDKTIKPQCIAHLDKIAKTKGLTVGMPVKDVETGKPLGAIAKIDSRGVYVRGKQRHPSSVEPV